MSDTPSVYSAEDGFELLNEGNEPETPGHFWIAIKDDAPSPAFFDGQFWELLGIMVTPTTKQLIEHHPVHIGPRVKDWRAKL